MWFTRPYLAFDDSDPQWRSIILSSVALPSKSMFGVRILKSESGPSIIPKGLSFSKFDTSEHTVVNSVGDSLSAAMQSLRIFLALLMRDSTVPWFHGLSAGPKCHCKPLSALDLYIRFLSSAFHIDQSCLSAEVSCVPWSEYMFDGQPLMLVNLFNVRRKESAS